MGVYGSYYLNWSSGGTVVLAAGVLFVVAFVFSGWRRKLPALGAGAH